MGVYRWRARDTKGMKFCGELRAGGEKEVAEFIQANYGYVTGIKEVRKRKLFIKRKITFAQILRPKQWQTILFF